MGRPVAVDRAAVPNIWDNHIRSSIGTRKVATLSSYDVERYFRELKAQGLAEASVRQVRAMLHRACRLARKWSGGALPNPIVDTELPARTLADRTEVRTPTVDEVVALLQAAADDVQFAVLGHAAGFPPTCERCTPPATPGCRAVRTLLR